MQAVQGWTNGRDSSRSGPTDELRRRCRGRGAPTGRGVADSALFNAHGATVEQCSSVQDGYEVEGACTQH